MCLHVNLFEEDGAPGDVWKAAYLGSSFHPRLGSRRNIERGVKFKLTLTLTLNPFLHCRNGQVPFSCMAYCLDDGEFWWGYCIVLSRQQGCKPKVRTSHVLGTYMHCSMIVVLSLGDCFT